MPTMSLFFLALCTPALAILDYDIRAPAPNPLWRRGSSRNIPPAGFYDPRNGNGSWLTSVPDTFPAGLGEPLNAIISASSDPLVLVDQQTDGGMRNYFYAVGFGSECLGQHDGSNQGANLGDGNGLQNQTAVLRWDYGDPVFGTCTETVEGGNHIRYWTQNGKEADSGAIFLAVSYEEPVADDHDIIFDGYNLGRDWMVGNATNQSSLVPTTQVTNGSTFSGQISYGGYTYQTDVTYLSGLLPNTSIGVNHNLTVSSNTTNALDGLVAVLNIKVVSKPTSSAFALSPTRPWHLLLSALLSIALPVILSL
ncbi:hypothetical protein OBBRIDRAFT_781260 [Obba rivulosa]|uniref:Uncharacterized protein n=1 Tax=Obba rivulosa TaxID=1052685 RepID=A0A8E2AW35_9APHY|nr:hypothetical protein OBBRIDRAFT_781260 [Obba rivulosa]